MILENGKLEQEKLNHQMDYDLTKIKIDEVLQPLMQVYSTHHTAPSESFCLLHNFNAKKAHSISETCEYDDLYYIKKLDCPEKNYSLFCTIGKSHINPQKLSDKKYFSFDFVLFNNIDDMAEKCFCSTDDLGKYLSLSTSKVSDFMNNEAQLATETIAEELKSDLSELEQYRDEND